MPDQQQTPHAETNGKTDPSATGQEQRDAKGRFTVGNKGGPGNPFARQVAGLRSRLIKKLDGELDAIVDALIAKAKTGDIAAIKLVLAYAAGKPSEPVHPDRLDEDEWEQYKATVEMTRPEAAYVLTTPHPELPLSIARIARPGMAEQLAPQIVESMLSPTNPFKPGNPHQKAARPKKAKSPPSPSTNGPRTATNPGFATDPLATPTPQTPWPPSTNGSRMGPGGPSPNELYEAMMRGAPSGGAQSPVNEQRFGPG